MSNYVYKPVYAMLVPRPRPRGGVYISSFCIPCGYESSMTFSERIRLADRLYKLDVFGPEEPDPSPYVDLVLSNNEVASLVSELGLVPGPVPSDFVPPFGRYAALLFCEAWKKYRRTMDAELIRFQNDFYRRNHYKYAVRKSYFRSCKEPSTKDERRDYFSSMRKMPALFEKETT